MLQEQNELNDVFYRSLRGNAAESNGMKGVLGKTDFSYVAKGRLLNSKNRVHSASLSGGGSGLSHRNLRQAQ